MTKIFNLEFPGNVEDIVYLDSAATVYPKPKEILDSTLELYYRYGINPGRSGYDLNLVGGNLVQETREQLCRFFGAEEPSRLCFASNASDALNLLIFGIVDEGDHVVSTNLEHNSVIRPLHHLARDRDVKVDFLRFGADGRIDPDDVARAITTNTKAVIVNHGSNVLGTVQPLAEIGRICREREVLLIVDVAQTAGVVPIDVGEMCIDALAFTGHKSLLGPMGIGGLYVRDGVDVKQTRAGGTGVDSANLLHPERYPLRLEVGTHNMFGIIGLRVAQDWLAKRGVESIYRHEMQLFDRLQAGLLEIPRVQLRGTTSLESRIPVLSFTIDGVNPANIGAALDIDYNVAVRTGLQCAPLVHEQLGTTPKGTVRLSIGPSNHQAHIETAIRAVHEIAAKM